MAAGDRLINPGNGGYAVHRVTNETPDASGYKEGAALVQIVGAGGAAINPAADSPETSTVYSGATALVPKFAKIDAATSGNNTLVAAVTGKKIRVLKLFVLAGAAGNIYFTSATGTVIFGGSANKINLAANGGFVLPGGDALGWMETVSGEALVMNASSTGPFAGGLLYVEV